MKHFIFYYIVIILLYVATPLCADNTIDIYYKNKKIGSFTIQEFTELINASEWAKEIKEAQNNNNVKVYITHYIPIDIQKQQYKAVITVEWYNTKKVKINYIVLETIITISPEAVYNFSEIRILYRNIAEIASPILFLLCIIFAIL